jgi:hypothetical protein
MGLGQSLAHAAEVFEPKTFSGLREQLDPAWILQALEDTGTVTVRHRRLPAEEMIWLVIGMALLRDRPIVDVARSLQIGGGGKPQSGGSVFSARTRLGKEPMQWLFNHSARIWAHRSAKEAHFAGLALYGLDGTSLRVPDSADNGARFGYQSGARGESGYPLVRLVALMALRSHLIVAASFGPYATSEYGYADGLWNELPDNSLCVVDRNFFSAKLLLRLHDAEKNRHWLIRGKARTQMTTLKKLADGDHLVELPVSPEARQKDPSLPLTYQARCIAYQRPGYAAQTLLTSMTDARKFPAKQIVAVYHERWELELGYDEIKTELLDRRESIRSKSPDGVEQEIWGLLLAYNLVRLFMQRVALIAKVAPVRISFVTSLRFIREQWWMDSQPHISVGAIPGYLKRLAEQLSRFVLPERRAQRSFPRSVKIKMSNYPRKRRATMAP